MVTKNGRVEEGKTPSVISGKPCTEIVQGEPVCRGEEKELVDPGLERVKKAFVTTPVKPIKSR